MNIKKKNFYLGVVNGALFIFASAFLSGNIVMPLFLSNFTSSKALIGLASAFLAIGWFLPQFFEGYFAESQRTKMPIYRFAVWIRLTSFALLISALFVFAGSKTRIAIAVLMVLIFFYSFSGGISGLAFMDIVAKTVPVKRRGAYFAARYFFGGLLGLLGGGIVTYVLGNSAIYPFPYNFVLLFTLAFIIMTAAFYIFMKVREPPDNNIIKRPFKNYYLEAVDNLAKNGNYRQLIVTRYLSGAASIAFPFYVLYAVEFLKITPETAGFYLLCQIAGGIVSNIFWGYLGDTHGNKTVLSVFAVLNLLAPVVALLSGYFIQWKHLFFLVFVFLGFADSGSSIGFFNFLLEISPERRRALHIGFMHTVTSFVLLIPTVGGLMMDKIPGITYNTIFMMAFVFGIAGLMATFGLVEPRKISSKIKIISTKS